MAADTVGDYDPVALEQAVAARWAPDGTFARQVAQREGAQPFETERFEAKARAAAGLRHRSIVSVHDFGVHEGYHFLTTEYIEGRSLAAILEEGPIAPDRAARLVREIARGGMGVVFEVTHRRTGVHYALKVLQGADPTRELHAHQVSHL